MVAEFEPRVGAMYEDSADPRRVIESLAADRTLDPRELEVAKQIVLNEAVRRRTGE